RIPQADGPVVASCGDLLAVGTVGHRGYRDRVTTEHRVLFAGGHIVQVNLVMVDTADRNLPARWAQHVRPVFPARSEQHEGGAIELAVKVVPFPVAVLRGRCLKGESGAAAIL